MRILLIHVQKIFALQAKVCIQITMYIVHVQHHTWSDRREQKEVITTSDETNNPYMVHFVKTILFNQNDVLLFLTFMVSLIQQYTIYGNDIHSNSIYISAPEVYIHKRIYFYCVKSLMIALHICHQSMKQKFFLHEKKIVERSTFNYIIIVSHYQFN